MKLFTKLFLIFSIFFLIYFFFLLSTSTLPINEFDGALKLISQYYTSLGLTPYKDFGVVYPPGYFILVGNIFKFISIFQRNIIYSFFYLFVIYFYIKIFLQSIHVTGNAKRIIISVFLISLTLVSTRFFYYDLFSILIIPIYLTFISLKNQRYRSVIYSLMFITPLFRWDTALIILMVSGFVIFTNLLFKIEKNSLKTSIGVSVSIILGFVLLFLYIYRLNSYSKAFDFIVNIPTFIIKPFRNLPIPPFKIRPFENMMFYTTGLLFLSYLFVIINNIKGFNVINKLKNRLFRFQFISLLIVILLIPYTLGRVSFGHTVPIWYLLITFFLIYTRKITKYVYLIIFLSFIPFITYYKNNIKLFVPKINNAEAIYNKNAIDCEKYKNVDAKSIFIGRTSYNFYEYNNVYLYYFYRNLLPATSYISDEPGIQDSCKYGSIISNELSSSKKPMIAFLATNPQIGFQNKKLVSCNKIEEYLIGSPYQIIGNCKSYGFEYEIRLYK